MLAVLPCQEEHADHSLMERTEEDGNDHETSGENSTPEIYTSISSEYKLDAGEVQKIHDLYEGIQDKSVPVSDSKELIKLEECIVNYKAFLAEKSRTAKLWLKYIEYMEFLKLLHLIAVEQMLNLFAATAHINYAKSSRLYLQLMQELPTDHPWLYHCFTEQGVEVADTRLDCGLTSSLNKS